MKADPELFEIKGKDASGRGFLTEQGFVVQAGSLARREIVPSALSIVTAVHQNLLSQGILERSGEQHRFVVDHLFNSPSAAAAAILGRSANGWQEWKNEFGQTMSQVKRISTHYATPLLSTEQKDAIQKRFQELDREGNVQSSKELERQYRLFRDKFGPDVLKGLDGVSLLTFMHDHRNRDCLVYWLEFKNDEEFATRNFGSIAGGSALKFRIFRRKETGNWQAGSEPKNRPEDITEEEAIEIARSHRDQLVKGCALLDAFPEQAGDEDYAGLQDQMDELAPDVSTLSWGHKYFSLLYPNKLDDYHSPAYQRFHLLKLLQLPPAKDGRYNCAGRFLQMTRELGMPINHLSNVINSMHGGVHKYWRVGTHPGESKDSQWPMMRDQNFVGIGWRKLGDLSAIESKQAANQKVKDLLTKEYPRSPAAIGRACTQICQFVFELTEGDLVLAAEGKTILGIGRIAGEYQFHSEEICSHQRPIQWLSIESWQLPHPEDGLQSTFRELKRFPENLLAIEQRLQSSQTATPSGLKAGPKGPLRLSGILGRIQSVLDRKGQVILYGPPGTGKTFWSEKAALELASHSAFGKPFESLDHNQKQVITGQGEFKGLVRLCCFHPAYGYEDFLEGFRPDSADGQVTFQLRDGVFKQLCRDAIASPDRNFYLIVDEINRGDIPRIFGELLTILEKEKRGKRVILPVSQEVFAVPTNVFLIGTMNTADRSISLLDAALRRRFGFVELMPDGTVLKDASVAGIPLRAWFESLNARIRENIGRDARNLQIGHSYLMHGGSALKDLASLRRVLRDDILPLLEEYCYENYATLATILGDQLVDTNEQRICSELFDEGQEANLIQAILSPFPEISASSEAVSSQESEVTDEDLDEEVDSEESEK
jgi:5-methylcytosine-specific restriction protein B